MDVLAVLVLLLSLARHSDAAYCVCNSGVSDSVLQKNIDYACWAGADCTAIQQNGACFNPNTVKDHCNYAVNSYYQRKGQSQGSCDFQGTATLTSNPPPSSGSGCVYQSNPSTGGTNTPPTSPTVGGTPTTPSVGGTPTTPSVGGTPASPTIGGMPTTPNAGGSTTPGSIPGASTNPGLGSLGPTGSGFSTTDSSNASPTLLFQDSGVMLFAISMVALLVSNIMC